METDQRSDEAILRELNDAYIHSDQHSDVARYELVDPAADGPSHRYLTVYELDDADIGAAAAAMNESAAAGKLDLSPAMDLAQRPPLAEWYRAYPA